jgi:hypothetical protein
MLQHIKQKLNLDDAYLMDIRGNVLYSVEKMPDFAVNVATGVWRTSPLGRAFAASMAIPQTRQVLDYEPYEPRGNALAKFVTQARPQARPRLRIPYHRGSSWQAISSGGKVVGVLGFQLGPDKTLEQSKTEFKEAREYVKNAIDLLWVSHNNLAFLYKTDFPEIKVQSLVANSVLSAVLDSFL